MVASVKAVARVSFDEKDFYYSQTRKERSKSFPFTVQGYVSGNIVLELGQISSKYVRNKANNQSHGGIESIDKIHACDATFMVPNNASLHNPGVHRIDSYPCISSLSDLIKHFVVNFLF